MYHQLNLFSVMSPQPVRLSTSVTRFVHCHVPVDGARHSNTDIDTPSSPRSTTRATPFCFAPNSNRSSFDSLIPPYFEPRTVQVDVEKLREHRSEGCSRISSLDIDAQYRGRQRFQRSEIFVISKDRDETRNVSFHGTVTG